MVGRELVESIDEGIKEVQKSVGEFPQELIKATEQIEVTPDRVRVRIRQLDGFFFEFDKS